MSSYGGLPKKNTMPIISKPVVVHSIPTSQGVRQIVMNPKK